MKQHSSQAGQLNHHGADTDWQMLWELELPLGADARLMFNSSLSEALAPLHVPAGLSDKILQSAEEATTRAMHAEEMRRHQPTRLLIYIPAGSPLHPQTWGFFRLEKIETGGVNSCIHSIAFYLYREEP